MTDSGGPAIPELTTDRLRLRGFTDADRAPFAAMNADPDVMEHFPSTLTRTESDALVDRILTRWAEDGHGLWAVERLDDGRLLGFAGIARLAWLETPEIGWRFARFAWGHGYATEAARVCVDYAFAVMGWERVVARARPGNAASLRVMEKLGFVRQGQQVGRDGAASLMCVLVRTSFRREL